MIDNRLKNIFGGHSNTTTVQSNTSISKNPSSKQVGETYHNWGLRICAIANGSCYTLAPYLQNVYNYIYNKQANNNELQEQKYNDIKCKIEQKKNDIENYNGQLTTLNNKQEEHRNKITELKEEKKNIKNLKYQVNKDARIKLVIGLIVLVPLTFYLFLFYSSTFYSAFFKNFTESANVLNSMFDAQALNMAYKDGLAELCFVLCAPIIFMGLGFILHYFTIQQGLTKYLKMGAIVCVTFVFDAILAYMIGKHLHDIDVMIGTAPLDSVYGLNEALSDIKTWAVIFCGFIVYIIWGLIFDMIMDAYGKLNLNRINICAIDDKIMDINESIATLDTQKQNLNNQITAANNEKAHLISQLSEKVLIDIAAIRQEINNFYSGWMAQMSVLGMSMEDKEKAKDTFDNTIKILFK